MLTYWSTFKVLGYNFNCRVLFNNTFKSNTINKIINTTLVFAPIFHELNLNIQYFFYVHKRPISLKYCSQICLNLCWWESCCPWIECRLQRSYREFGSTSNRPHNRRPRVTTPAQDLHIQHLHLQDRLKPATRKAAAKIGLHNQIK